MTTTTHYVVELETALTYDEDLTDNLIDALIDHHPAIGATPEDKLAVTVTLPADSLTQAFTTALALTRDLFTSTAITVIPETTRDLRLGLGTDADDAGFVTTKEAAKHLGLTRQMVNRRIKDGDLPATRVGRDWAIPRSALPKMPPKKARPGVAATAAP